MSPTAGTCCASDGDNACILRSTAYGALSPAKFRADQNDLLHPDIPPKMFVTRLYAIDPVSGQLLRTPTRDMICYLRRQRWRPGTASHGMPWG